MEAAFDRKSLESRTELRNEDADLDERVPWFEEAARRRKAGGGA